MLLILFTLLYFTPLALISLETGSLYLLVTFIQFLFLQPLAATHLISFPTSLFLKHNWTTALCLFLVHNPGTISILFKMIYLQYVTLQRNYIVIDSALHIVPSMPVSHSFFNSYSPSPVPLFLPPFTSSGNRLFVLCIYDSDSLFLCFFICFTF